MKKQLLFISTLIMVLSANVVGAEVINSISETENGVESGMKKIIIDGKIPVNDNDDLVKNAVTLTVFKTGIGIGENGEADLSEIDLYGDGEQIEYTNQTTADADGTYSFSYTMSAETGDYLIRIGYNAKDDSEETHRIYKYVSPADFINFETGLEEAFSKKDEEGYDASSKIIELVKTYSEKGVLNIPVYEEMEKDETVLKFIGDYILSFEKPENTEEFSKKFEEGVIVEKMNKKTPEEIKNFFENENNIALLGINEEVITGFESNDEKQKEIVYSVLAGKELIGKDIKSIADDITNSIILSEFDSLLWQGNMQVLEKYQTYLNIAFNDYNALSDIEKKNYAMTEFAKGIESLKNVNEVKELFDESVKKGKNYSSGKGNGYSDSRNESSSGGGKGSGGGGTSIVIGGGIVTTPTVTEKNEVPKVEEKNEKRFNDTKDYPWASDAIERLAELNIVAGDGNGNFRPGDTVKREEFLKMILTALDLKKTDADVFFNDVTKDKWYYEYVQGGIYYHLITGISKEEFGSGRDIKRADAAVIMDRVLNMYGKEYSVKEIVYQDVLKNDFDYAYEAIYRVSEAKLMNGTSQTKFEPARSITRAEAAVVIDRVIKLLENN